MPFLFFSIKVRFPGPWIPVITISLLVKTDLKRAVDDGCSIKKSKIRFNEAFSKFKTRNISLSGLTAKTTSSDIEKYWKENYNIG